MLIAFITFVIAVLLAGLGNTVGYHRLLTHRSFKTSRPVRYLWTLLGAVYSGSPVLWVGLHRFHHARSDTDEDPHSPTGGFWWSHSGWLIGSRSPLIAIPFALSGFGQQALILWHDVKRLAGRNPPTWRKLCRDLMEDPFMRALDAPLVMPALFAAQVAAAWAVAGWWGILWLWAVHLWLTNTSWAVNSICHTELFGTRPHDTREGSRNVAWLALFTNGESYHNHHHRHPRSARHGLDGSLDLSWWVIRGMVALRLAHDPWLPKKRKRRRPAST